MDYMSIGVGDCSAACEVDNSTAAANAVGVVTMDFSAGVPNDICERLYGGSIQGYYLLMRLLAVVA